LEMTSMLMITPIYSLGAAGKSLMEV